ncbi:hypothetical protein [Fontibacillus sp. BL9]|uniref:hypothetical protein n=1 Tax=Fontibacillus sp. BL9 TaxID=3389971 RepID=UPI00397D2F95
MNQRLKEKIIESIECLEGFKPCGPSSDPDEISNVIYVFSIFIKKFKYYASRIDDEFLRKTIGDIDTRVSTIYEVYDIFSDVRPIMQDVKDYISEPSYSTQASNDLYVSRTIITSLLDVKNENFDLKKLVQLCIEINSNYHKGNYISVSLLIRALINYIPPIFDSKTFQQVVANSSRSIKEILKQLDENLRDIADFHTHQIIRRREELPTKNQLEPYKGNLEILLHEILIKLTQ